MYFWIIITIFIYRLDVCIYAKTKNKWISESITYERHCTFEILIYQDKDPLPSPSIPSDCH